MENNNRDERMIFEKIKEDLYNFFQNWQYGIVTPNNNFIPIKNMNDSNVKKLNSVYFVRLVDDIVESCAGIDIDMVEAARYFLENAGLKTCLWWILPLGGYFKIFITTIVNNQIVSIDMSDRSGNFILKFNDEESMKNHFTQMRKTTRIGTYDGLEYGDNYDSVISRFNSNIQESVSQKDKDWNLVVRSMKYIREDAFDKIFPKHKDLSFKQKVKKLQDALYHLPDDKKEDILKSYEMNRVRNIMKKTSKFHKRSAAVGGTGTAGITATTVGMTTSALNKAAQLSAAGMGVEAFSANMSAVAYLLIGGITSLGALAITTILTTAGLINASYKNKKLKKEAVMKSESEILKNIKETGLLENVDFYDFILKENYSHELINDNEISLKNIKSPEELNEWMIKNIKYEGPYDKIRSPENLLKNKKGQCHEQALFAYKYLSKIGYKPKYWFLYNVDKDGKYIDGDGATHAFVTYENNGKVYWFETAFKKFSGIHEFNNYDDLKKTITNILLKYSPIKGISNFIWTEGILGKPGDDIWDFCRKYIPNKSINEEDK